VALAGAGAATFEGIVESEAGRIVDCNEQCARMAGRPVAELRGLAIAELIAPEDRERVLANVQPNRESTIEHGMRRKDGTRLVVEAHGRPVATGGARRYTAVRDITERKKAEAQIQEQMNELARFNDAMVGRESPIIELKQEVNAWLAAAGKPPRYASTEREEEEGDAGK
jgi:PAS domain S-box-containing protein